MLVSFSTDLPCPGLRHYLLLAGVFSQEATHPYLLWAPPKTVKKSSRFSLLFEPMIIAFASGPELDKKQPMKNFLFTGYHLPGDIVRAHWGLYLCMCNVGMVGVIFAVFFFLCAT